MCELTCTHSFHAFCLSGGLEGSRPHLRCPTCTTHITDGDRGKIVALRLPPTMPIHAHPRFGVGVLQPNKPATANGGGRPVTTGAAAAGQQVTGNHPNTKSQLDHMNLQRLDPAFYDRTVVANQDRHKQRVQVRLKKHTPSPGAAAAAAAAAP